MSAPDLIIRRAITPISELPAATKCFWRYPHKKIIEPRSSWLGNITCIWY